MENKKAKREALAKITEYATFFGNKRPNIETVLIRYQQASKYIGQALYHHFGAFNTDNPHIDEDLESLNEAFQELEKLKEII